MTILKEYNIQIRLFVTYKLLRTRNTVFFIYKTIILELTVTLPRAKINKNILHTTKSASSHNTINVRI